ncbi:class C beta-lactamase [Aureimonas pseudogalii]|uniref:Beta-lactamase n=1 Tax=Aureimonas pseudogalii TaxID=1744844 RepID=A0A7W6H6S8_9HYPH|nr:class C beta-lactamase [Aureimonas pseudogalii]MBB3999586.1 beta-lactamase class C [Aureimonas pseudogalii]
MIRSLIASAAIAAVAGIAPAAALTPDQFRAIAAKVFGPVVAAHDIPGLAVGATIDGETFFYTAGEAVRATHAPVTVRTIFELGSVSKLFNVALAALAEERGLLSLGDSVSNHRPALSGSAFDAITLLNLATHTTGGLPLQVPDSVGDAGAPLTAYLRTFQPTGDPNASRSYSNVSIGLLGQITAERFGQPYPELARERLFEPLGLASTFIKVPAEAADRYAFGYTKDANRPVRVNPGVLDAEAYGVKSSVEDMTRFLAAHLGTVEVPDEISAALARTRTGVFETQPFVQDLVWEQYPWPVDAERLKAGNSSAMALTVQPVRRLDPPLAPASKGVFLNKTGGTGGFGSYVALVPGEKLGIVVLANRNTPNEVRAEATRQLIEAIEAALPD